MLASRRVPAPRPATTPPVEEEVEPAGLSRGQLLALAGVGAAVLLGGATVVLLWLPAFAPPPQPQALTWSGTLGEAELRIELEATPSQSTRQLSGTSRLRGAAGSATAQVSGSFDPRTGSVDLREAEPVEATILEESGVLRAQPILPEARIVGTWKGDHLDAVWQRAGVERPLRLEGPPIE